jgi:predicted site-specific integrase-resolvase
VGVNEPLLLTEEQAAERLLMHPRTLRKLRQTGQIRYVALIGRKIAYRPEDCAEFVESHSKVETLVTRPVRSSGRAVGKRRHGNIVPFSIRQENRG